VPLQALLCGAALAGLAGRVEAADARYRFSIQPKSYADALIDLGIQANVSVVGTAACGQGGRVRLSGRHTLQEALSRLLAGAPCRFTVVDARTVRISAAPPPPAQPKEVERPPAAVVLTELVVTATKRPVSLERLPAGVSAISREQVLATGAVEVGQTTGQLAGVLSTNLGPGRDKLLIRRLSDGAFTGRARSTVATYLDDAPLNYNAPDPDLRLVDVERIEVLRGPQGALYGSGAISGIYRIVTRKPQLAAFEAGVSGSAAYTRGGDASYDLEGYLNVPLIPGTAAARLVAYEDRQGGYLDDVDLRISDLNLTRRNGGRAGLSVQLSDNWRVDLLAATQNLRSNDTQYERPPTTVRPPVGRVRETHNNDVSSAGATLQGELRSVSLSSSSTYVRHEFSSQYDTPAGTEPFRFFGGRDTDLGVFLERSEVEMVVQDFVLRSARPGGLDWLIGAYASRTIEDTPSTFGFLGAGGEARIFYEERRKDRLSEIALYGEATLDVAPGWSVTAGGRLFESDVRTTADVVVRAPGMSRFFERARTFNGFLPKLSIQREFASGDFLYALYSEGYRPGGFNSGGLLAIRQSRTSFAPDRLRNYEAGAKLRLLDGRMSVRSAVFYDAWSDIQSDQYRPSGLAFTGNAGDGRIIGLEAEVSHEWDFGLSLQVNGLLARSKVRDTNLDFASGPTPRVIDELPGVPDLSGGLLAIYQRPIRDGLSLRLVGEASYVGRAAISFDAALPQRSSAYMRVKLSAELATERLRATLFVTNPLDDEGDTFAYGNPFNFGQAQAVVTPQRPRTVGVRLAATF
jgi:iron complex outermembrane recepter protein